MNVLLDPWIAVESPDGSQFRIAPIDLPQSDAVRVVHPRADHSALLTELLVCMFQTLAAPRDERQKLAYLAGTESPQIEALRGQASAFELFDNGPRFLQACKAAEKIVPASYFSYEAPAGNTLKTNKDFFVSRDAVQSLCPRCAATGLFLCQSHARMGGTGYFGGPRGTSALTALLEGESLWQTVCLNLLTAEQFAEFSNVRATPDTPSFPWLSHPHGFERAPTWDELGPYGVLWWTPVALRLNESTNTRHLPCDLCGDIDDIHVTSVAKEATPVVPQGVIRHPHTGWRAPDPEREAKKPSKKKKRPGPSPIEVPTDGFTAETWTALVLGDKLIQSLAAPLYLKDRRWQSRAQLRVFGPATENNSLLWWLDQTRPVVFALTDTERQALRAAAARLLQAARRAVFLLKSQIGPRVKIGQRLVPLPLTQSATQLSAALWDQSTTQLIDVITRVEYGELLEDDLNSFTAWCRETTLRTFDESVLLSTYEPALTAEILKRRGKLARALVKL